MLLCSTYACLGGDGDGGKVVWLGGLVVRWPWGLRLLCCLWWRGGKGACRLGSGFGAVHAWSWGDGAEADKVV